MNNATKDDISATQQDISLLKSLHPISTGVLRWASSERMRKIPGVGMIVTDGELIRFTLRTKAIFSKQGKGVSSSFWNPIIGETGLLNMDGTPHLTLKRSLSNIFTSQNIEPFISADMLPALKNVEESLTAGEQVDLLPALSEFVYKALWRFAGFSDEIIQKHYTNETIQDLRSATHGVNIAKKKLSRSQILKARRKLSFIDVITEEAYLSGEEAVADGTVIKTMMQEGYTLKEVTSLMKSLMIAGTETVISFIPRMVALLIDSGKMETLTADEIDRAVDECLRVTVPTPVAVRVARQDTLLGDRIVKRGERVILNTLGACHNEGPFSSELPPVSREVKGLWFGAGVHMCVGLPIAMYESRSVLESLINTQEHGKLVIVDRKVATAGHTGSYESLTLQLMKG